MYLQLSLLDNNYINHPDDLVLVRPGALNYKQKKELSDKGITFTELSDIILDDCEIDSFRDYFMDFFERIMVSISESLNEMHNTNYSVKFWKIAVGRRVYDSLQLFYVRYAEIKQALDKFGTISTTLLSKTGTWYPNNSTGRAYNSEYVSWYIASRIVEELDCGVQYDYCYETLSTSLNNDSSSQGAFQKKGIKQKLFEAIFSTKKSSNVMIDSPGYITDIKKLTITSHFKIKPCCIDFGLLNYNLCQMSKGKTFTNTLRIRFSPNNEYEGICVKYVNDFVSCVFTGIFDEAEKLVKPYYENSKVKIVCSANSYFYSDAFNLYAAHMSVNGAKIVTMDHGGTGPLHKYFNAQEYNTYDYFMGWGNKTDIWNYNNALNGLNIKCMGYEPYPKHSKDKRIKVLYIGEFNGLQRRSVNAAYETQVEKKIKNGLDFLKIINDDGILEATVRKFFVKENIESIDDHIDELPNIKIQNPYKINFMDAVREFDICVMDDLSTPFFELSALDKPIIIMMYPGAYHFTDDGKEIFRKFEEQHIVFTDGKKCAEYIKSIKDPYEWWHEPERYAVIQEFCYKYNYLPDKKIRYKELADCFLKLI